MVGKRSPRYPRLSLGKAIDLAARLYGGAHRSKVDVETAARVMGYSNSSSGAAASSLGALRQYGLVDGLRGDVQISELALRIIQPMDEAERTAAIREAAARPEIFALILGQFHGELPRSDEPIRAYLVRQQDFSSQGAGEVVSTLRETLASLPPPTTGPSPEQESDQSAGNEHVGGRPSGSSHASAAIQMPLGPEPEQLIVLPLGTGRRAEVRFFGDVTATVYDRLIKHLSLLSETLADDEG